MPFVGAVPRRQNHSSAEGSFRISGRVRSWSTFAAYHAGVVAFALFEECIDRRGVGRGEITLAVVLSLGSVG